MTAFIGPSGCGKSTLLRVLNRMYDLYPQPARRGRGRCSTARTSCRPSRTSTCCARASAWCSRSRRRSRCRSTRTSPSASGSTRSCRSPSSTSRVETSLRRAALWDEVKDKLDANGLSLSGGQQQRLCIARTVAVKPEVILFDEPCSALDPISTAKIEELIDELKDDYTIVIVTHNMQQAARVSDFTAFMYLGELIEFDATEQDVHRAAATGARRTTSPAASADATAAARTTTMMNEHTAKAFDVDLQELDPHGRRDGRAGREADRRRGRCAGAARRRAAPSASSPPTPRIDALQREIEEKAVLTIARRQPMAVDLREIVGALRIANDLERIGDLAKNIAKRVLAIDRRFPSAEADPRRRAHGRAGARPSSRRCSTPMPATTSTKALAVWNGDEEIDAHVHLAVPRAAHLHDGRSAQHHVLHPSAVLRQEHRAHGRPRHQHRRDRLLHDRRPRRSPTSGRRATPLAVAASPSIERRGT